MRVQLFISRILEAAGRACAALSRRKKALATAGVAAALIMLAPAQAHAWSLFSLADMAQTVVAKIFFGIAAIITFIAGIVIAIEAWFLEIILNLNLNIVNSTPVKIGFPIVLAFANLAFVAGIIFIAIATILRREHYAMKSILWKLIVMAVLVNFGLVICGALLSVSDQMTLFFINSVNPLGSGTGGSGGDMGAFVSALAGMFNPQESLFGANHVVKDPFAATDALSGFATAGQNLSKLFLPLTALLATLGALVIIIITLGTMVLMLLVRYVKLGMLLILLPLAWTGWIFPAYEGHFHKWWQSFTKNAIFPPVMIFFVWLSLKISEVMSQSTAEYQFTQYQSNATNSAWAAISTYFSNIFSPQIEQLLRIFIIWGLMMGGLMASQELGVKFADAGNKAVDGVGKWAKGKAGHYTKRASRASYQKLGGRRFEEGLIKNKWNSAFLSNLGRGIQGFTQKGGSEIVDQEAKDLHIPSTDGQRAEMLEKEGLRLPQVLAVLGKMQDLSKVKKIGNKSFAEWLEENHQKMADYNQHDLEGKVKDMGASHDVLAALNKRPGADMDAAVAAAVKKSDPKALAGLLKDGALGITDPDQLRLLREAIVKNIGANFSVDQFADFSAGLKSDQKKNLVGAMQVTFAIDPATGRPLAPGDVKKRAYDLLGKEIAEYIRDNGTMQDRGFRSDELWGEKRGAYNNRPAAGAGGGPGTPTPPPSPTPPPPPAPGGHGGGHGGSGGGGGTGGGHGGGGGGGGTGGGHGGGGGGGHGGGHP